MQTDGYHLSQTEQKRSKNSNMHTGSNRNRWLLSGCITCILSLCGLQQALGQTPSDSTTSDLVLLDRVAIIVNDQSILESDIHNRLQDLKQQIKKRQDQVPPNEVLLPQLIERLTLESIQDQMADRFQIKISDTDINTALARIAKRNNLDLEAYTQQLKNQGQSMSSVRSQIKNELKHFQLQQRMLSSQVEVTEKEVEQFLQSKEALESENIEYKIRHILLQINERATPKEVAQRQAQATAVIEAIRNGENTFEEAAMAMSNDSFALKGGDMGWRRLSQVPSRFATPLLKLKPGELSKPIRSPSGFHILFLEAKKGEGSIMVERAKIEHILIKPNQIRSEQQAEQFATELRQDILDGKKIAELARTFSDDPGSALNGGDLGWVSLESLDKTFAKTAKTVKINNISPVFRSEFGFHILRVTDRRQEDMSQATRKSKAQRWLQQRKFEEYLPVWLSEIRAQAYIELKPPYDTQKLR